LGCFRSPEEIANWTHLNSQEKWDVMKAATQRMNAYLAVNLAPASFDFPIEFIEE
jgi:predicted Fe-S protein YdhL (DUF1289 family)